MPSRTRQRIVAHFSEPMRLMALVGWAAGLGLVPRMLSGLPVEDTEPAYWGKVAFLLLCCAAGGAVAATAMFLVEAAVRVLRGFAVGHRRAARIAGAAVSAVMTLLAVSGAVALGWSGEPAGTVATVVVKAVCACVVGTGSALLSLVWVLVRFRRRAVPHIAVALSLYLSLACFLFFVHVALGLTLVVVALVLSFAWTVVMRETPGLVGATLGLFLLLGAVACEEGGSDRAFRPLAQAAVAVVMGTVTVQFVRRCAYWHGRLGRFATAAAIVPLAYVMYLWFDGQLLGGALEVPLFAPMVWLVVRLWRRMQQDRRTPVSAAADIVFAVLLGAVLVLFLVWLANVLDLPVAEVRALRGAAAHLGDLIDLPWWTWASADVLLAAVFLTAALGPRRFRRISEGLGRIRLPGGLDVLRRTLSVLKIVLLSLVFLGLAGPPALDPVLSRHIRARYTAELQQELDARGEAALYQDIALRFARSPQALPVLTEMLERVHDSAAPRSGGSEQGGRGDRGEPTPAARDLAYRMGELQARTLLPFSLPSLDHPTQQAAEPPTAAAVRAAGMNGTAADAADLGARLTREQDTGEDANESEHQAEQAAEHAAAVVTGALGNLTFGHGIVIGLVRAYLDGLAESGLRTVFLRWTDRALPGSASDEPSAAAEPPAAARLVEPEPRALQVAADAQLTDELLSAGVEFGTDPAQARDNRESPLAAAVDLAIHTRGLQQGTVRCTDCVHFVEPGEGGGEHGGEEPGGVHVE